MSSVAALEAELGRWAAERRMPTFWWRDDDAASASPALEGLLSLSRRHDLPLALAVVPASLEPGAARLIVAAPQASVLQHGYRHLNLAQPGEKKSELPPSRDPQAMLDDLRTGARIIAEAFGVRAHPALVPPWNRIAPGLVSLLPSIGVRGLSRYLVREAALAAPGVVQVNCHVDLIDWRGSRGFIGEGVALGLLVQHLAARRSGAADEGEPTGILSHHAVHDEACWDFLDALFRRLAGRGRFLSAAELFPRPDGAGRSDG